MGTMESMKFWVSFLASSWRAARDDDSGGITDEAAMMGALAAAAILVGAALGPWLVGKVTTINIGW